jgi:hypothetical protein
MSCPGKNEQGKQDNLGGLLHLLVKFTSQPADVNAKAGVANFRPGDLFD